MEVRLSFEDDYINELKRRISADKTSDVVREGLALLDWATEAVAKGRVIMSIRSDGGDPERIESPALSKARSLKNTQKQETSTST